MFGWIRNMFGSRGRSVHSEQWDAYRRTGRLHRIEQKYQARYDSAQRNPSDERYWSMADHLSAVASNSLDVRRKLRSKARYEVANSCHPRGITMTLANDLIGTGARLQIGGDDDGLRAAIETPWNAWADEINLAEKLHTFCLSEIVDGEGVMVKVLDEELYSSVKMNLDVRECDLMSSPVYIMKQRNMVVDGIELDDRGRPKLYHFLRIHPGDNQFFSLDVINFSFSPEDFTEVPARNVFHFFRVDRPGQVRGIPHLTPALPIFSQLRRFTMATLAAAEIAADFAMFISTDGPADYVAPDSDPGKWDTTNIDKGMLTQLPYGYKPFQLKAEQPVTGHNEFCKGLLREACHALLIPYNIANADFEGDSYAGGRMGLQVYQRYLRVRRKHLMQRILTPIFHAWFDEAILVPGLLSLPGGTSLAARDIPHTWFFDGWGHVDRTKESTADTTDIQNGTTTLAELCAEEGFDWRDIAKQQGKEKKFRTGLGLDTVPAPTTTPNANAEAPQGAAV